MEFGEVTKANQRFTTAIEEVRQIAEEKEVRKAAKEAGNAVYSEAVQQRLANIDPDSLTPEEMTKLKLGLFGEIEETARELLKLFPSGDFEVGDGSYSLHTDGDVRDCGIPIRYIGLRHSTDTDPYLGEDIHNLSYIVEVSRSDDEVSRSLGELLDAQETLDGALEAIRTEQSV